MSGQSDEAALRLKQLAEVGRSMRQLQQRFFDGDKSVINECRNAERRFDRLVGTILNPQGNLFDTREAA